MHALVEVKTRWTGPNYPTLNHITINFHIPHDDDARRAYATRHNLPDEFKSLKGRDLRTHLSQLWKAADPETKTPFEESHPADKVVYEAAMRSFEKGHHHLALGRVEEDTPV